MQVHPEIVSVDYVKNLQDPTDRFLCKLSDNWAQFKFRGFKIREMTQNITLVDVPDEEQDHDPAFASELEEDPSKRMIKYHLGPDFLHLTTVGLTMNFSIGPTPIEGLEMVERHYFRGKVIRDYSFKFGFVIPNSTNSWEFIYDLPELTQEEMDDMIAHPWEVKSDSFFFAKGVLMMHNRCEYNYSNLQ